MRGSEREREFVRECVREERERSERATQMSLNWAQGYKLFMVVIFRMLVVS